MRAEATNAEQQGINSTPTFLIGRVVDGKLKSETVQGAQPPEVFVKQIETLLAE